MTLVLGVARGGGGQAATRREDRPVRSAAVGVEDLIDDAAGCVVLDAALTGRIAALEADEDPQVDRAKLVFGDLALTDDLGVDLVEIVGVDIGDEDVVSRQREEITQVLIPQVGRRRVVAELVGDDAMAAGGTSETCSGRAR